MSQNKIKRIERVLTFRTRYITLILEDIYKDHNASATLRTCECLGIQDVHIIEKTSPFTVNHNVTQGSSKWLSLHRYKQKENSNTQTCYKMLQKKGYKIIAATPNEQEKSLTEISLNTKLAFVFGNEEKGLSEYALQAADVYMKLPMYGFTQSYNISVSVAITLSYILEKLHQSKIAWQLTDTEKSELTLLWYKKIVRRSDLIEKKFLNNLISC
jgi:tRNA (guanosine-2'-O-)-methyltransferase